MHMDERKKLDSKAQRCVHVFLRYGSRTKGYRLYDASRCRVIHSRDVSFNESTRGFEIEKESVKDKEPQVVPLDGMEQTIDDDSNQSDEATPNEAVNQTEPEPAPTLRRSTRESKLPDRYGVWVNTTTTLSPDLLTVCDALNSSEQKEW